MTKDELKDAVAARGNYFFSPSTMRFFSSRVGAIYPYEGGAYFVTSEQFIPPGSQFGKRGPRRFTVRKWNGKTVTTIGAFQAYGSREAANAAAERAAKGVQTADEEVASF